METQKVLTVIEYPIGTILEMDDEHYKVIESRALIPFLGEPEGFRTVLQKIVRVQ